jgi:hypothetical protein
VDFWSDLRFDVLVEFDDFLRMIDEDFFRDLALFVLTV